MCAASAYIDIGLDATVTCTAAAFLTALLLGAVGNLAAVLCLGCTLTVVCQILEDVEIDGMIIRLDTENFLVEHDLLSGFSSVDLLYCQFHN